MAESNLCYSLDKLVKNTSDLQLKMVPVTAEPGPTEVRIKVHAAGVNFYDYLMARGEYVLVARAPPFHFLSAARTSQFVLVLV